MSDQIQELEGKEMVTTGAGSNTPVGKILVVDDEPELRSVLVESLQRHGYEVTGCGSGRNALAELRERDFDLLLTDLMMPEMDGIALLKAALEIDPHVVGIIVTGQGTIQTAVDAMQIGAFDYVLKPFRMQTLMPVLTRAMNVRHLKLENVQLRETLAIHSLCQTIAFTLDPQTVLSKLADAALQQSDADEVSVLLPTNDGKELYVAAVRGTKRERLLGERIPFEQSIASWVARERKPLILNGEVHDERFVALWPRPEIRSAVSVPMQVANKLVGIINLNVTSRLRPFTLGQMKALTILASTAAAALESASLYSQVQQAEQNYRSIFDNAVEGVFQSTAEGRFLTVNPSMARILGYESPGEVIATITDIAHQLYVHPESRAKASQIQEERGLLHGFEFEAYRKGGEKIWLSVNRRSVRNENGTEIYREGSIEDITERKRAEEVQAQLNAEIREQRERLNTIVASVPGIVFEASGRPGALDNSSEFVSEYIEQMLGYTVSEWLSAPGFWLSIVHPEDRDRVAREAAAQFATCRKGELEFRWIGKDKRIVWVRAHTIIVCDEDGKPVGVRGVVTDITERRLAEDALRESEERYKGLIDSAFDGVVIHRDGRIVSANRAYAVMFGYGVEELIGMDVLEFNLPEYRDLVSHQIAQDESSYESVGLKKDGTAIAIEISGQVCIYEGQRARLAAVRDITEPKRVEEMQARRAAHALFRADVSAALAISRAPLRATLESCVTAMVQHLRAAFARIWTLNREEEVLELQVSAGMYTHIDGPHSRVPVGSFKIGKIAQERAAHITNEVQTDPRVSDKEWARREGMVAFAGYPLIVDDRLLGVMALFSRDELPEDTLDALASVADLISQGIERKRAEDALRESEERYRDLVENAHDLIYEHDLEGNYTSTNKAGEQITGYSLEESLKLNLKQTVAPNYLEKAEQMFSRTLAGEKVTAYDLEIIAKDGHHVMVEVNTRLVLKDGVPVGVQGIARDITERKRAEEQLRRQLDFTEAITASLGEGVYALDEHGRVTFMNPASEAALQWKQAELLGKVMHEVIHFQCMDGTRRPADECPLLRVLRSGLTIQVESDAFTRKDGTMFPVSYTSSPIITEGQVIGAVLAFHDITERKRAEEELRESEERYRLLFESSPQPMWVYDLETLAFLAVNESAVHHYGYSREDFLAMTIKDIRPAKDIPALYDAVARVSKAVDAAGIWRHLKKDGTIIEVEITSHLLEFDDRRAELILAHDMTERNRLVAALLASEEQLRQSQKLEAIGQLAGGVAHDFNNLLTVIGGYSSILLGKLPQESPHRSSLEEIKKASDRASGLTRQLLAFSRKQILQPKVLDLNIVVTDLEKMVRRLIGEDIDLLTITSPVLGRVKADPGQIEQVLLNLIVNARDAMPKGGKLTIETRNVVLSEEYAQGHAALPGPYVMLAVSDTGCGMDATIQPRVFEPFFTTKVSGRGTGLGLATVYGIVKQSGGNIWVYSEVGRGSTFKVYLPRVDDVTAGEEEVISKSIPQGTEMVLLVEDEDQVRAILKHILEGLGYHVLSASNGEEAFSISQDLERDIKLMITDVVMPQMSGRELAERVLAVRPNLPVLFMSGYTDDAIVRHGLLDEKLNFLQKPFDPAGVARKVREVLDSQVEQRL